MQKDLHAKVKQLENLIAIQKGCVTDYHTTFSDYMIGMFNGLEMAHSIFVPGRPNYIKPPIPRNRVRHRIKNKDKQ